MITIMIATIIMIMTTIDAGDYENLWILTTLRNLFRGVVFADA